MTTLGAGEFLPAGVQPDATVWRQAHLGAILRAGLIAEAKILQPNHPLSYGYAQKTIMVRYDNVPMFNVLERDQA